MIWITPFFVKIRMYHELSSGVEGVGFSFLSTLLLSGSDFAVSFHPIYSVPTQFQLHPESQFNAFGTNSNPIGSNGP